MPLEMTEFGLGFLRSHPFPQKARKWMGHGAAMAATQSPDVCLLVAALCFRLIFMEFRVLDLEREPIEFDLKLAPCAIDFGEEAVQVGDLATSGSAEVIH